MSRLISSYLLAGALHPLAGLRLSYEVRNDLSKYYKAFRTCNDPKNKGDLTPFIAVFISIIRSACEQLLMICLAAGFTAPGRRLDRAAGSRMRK